MRTTRMTVIPLAIALATAGVAWAVGIPLLATAIVVVWKGPETLSDFITLRMNQVTPDYPTRWGLSDVTGLPYLVAYGMGAVLALLAWRYASFSLVVLAMLVVSPALHAHYLIWLLVPFIGIWMPWLVARRSPESWEGDKHDG